MIEVRTGIDAVLQAKIPFFCAHDYFRADRQNWIVVYLPRALISRKQTCLERQFLEITCKAGKIALDPWIEQVIVDHVVGNGRCGIMIETCRPSGGEIAIKLVSAGRKNLER